MLMATDVALFPPGGFRLQWSISLLASAQDVATGLFLTSCSTQRVAGAWFLPEVKDLTGKHWKLNFTLRRTEQDHDIL